MLQCVQWHANCNYVATGSSDKTVRLWDVQSGECVRIFIGHRSTVLSLAMSPDGRFMASGDEDGTIMMWDLSSGRCISPLMGHSSCVWTLAFSKPSSINRLRLLKGLPTKSTPVYTLQVITFCVCCLALFCVLMVQCLFGSFQGGIFCLLLEHFQSANGNVV
ncbi:hypothetical protein BHE74_00034253 [Ensete ventricosum]|nr:hypothetical protein BHE74_00034253 [Ensete ventricosum]